MTKLKKKAGELKTAENSNWFGLDEYVDEAKKNISPVARYGSLSLVSLRVRAMATYLRAALPLNKEIANNRLDELRRNCSEFESLRDQLFTKLDSSAGSVDATFRREAKITEYKQKVTKIVEDANSSLGVAYKDLEDLLRSVAHVTNHESESAIPLELFATFQDGQVTILGLADRSADSLSLPEEAVQT